jgi:hypothetical protein
VQDFHAASGLPADLEIPSSEPDSSSGLSDRPAGPAADQRRDGRRHRQHAGARASELVGGADGDLFNDGMLIDIKVNKHLELGRDVFNQIFGYFCLACIGGVDGCRGKVTCVAVYFARCGLLHRLPIKSFVEADRLPAHLKWFKNNSESRRQQHVTTCGYVSRC